MAELVYLAIHPDLKRLLGQLADKNNLPLNEQIAQLLAAALKRPDLAAIPRGKLGRPRKDLAEAK